MIFEVFKEVENYVLVFWDMKSYDIAGGVVTQNHNMNSVFIQQNVANQD
jgi:hypothetical protein